MTYIAKDRKNERGITMVLVAVALVSVLAMAALAVDVLALYVARSEAQRAADAGALAAAKMFAFTGYTSNFAITQAQLCVNGGAGSTAAANKAAETVISQNTVAGQAATLQNITCDLITQPENPRVTITVHRTGLPVLFGRIWAAAASSVSATASAEAFNPSGGSVPIAVASVKPWLIPNCLDALCATGPKYFTTTFGIFNSGAFIGTQQTFSQMNQNNNFVGPLPPNGVKWWYYALDPPAPNNCPSSGALSCTQVGNSGPPGAVYRDNIACSNTAFQYSCGQQIATGQPVQFNNSPGGSLNPRAVEGVTCLIHASSSGSGNGQDIISSGLPPVIITGGSNNPNPALQNVPNISRSDSVVTVPVYAGGNACPTSGSSCSAIVIGFLQLGIQDVGGSGDFDAVIMNASPCNPANTGTPVTGGALSSIPVRLIHQ
jgi:hypothetical protein